MKILSGLASLAGLLFIFSPLLSKPSPQNISCDMAPSNTTTSSKPIFLKDNFSTHYFYNLNENYGFNAKGSCTYIALAQLLSFWDTYWDDSVIAENFDVPSLFNSIDEVNLNLESPGIYEEPDLKGMSTQEYYNFVELHSGAYFQLHLISIGKELFGQYKFDDASSPCALSYDQLQELANYYLFSERGFTKNRFALETETGDLARSFTIKKIKQGIPVEIRMAKKVGNRISGGHAMVAYDYDDDSDKIYVHPGWHNGVTHVTLDNLGYNVWWDATAVVPKGAHSESNNYIFSSGYCKHTHCSCEFSIHPSYATNHPHMKHDFTNSYISGCHETDSFHKAFCGCGEWKWVPHYYGNVYMTSDHHIMGYCTQCGGTFRIR